MKTYRYSEQSWWDSCGCSCCEPTEMVYYEPIEFNVNGSPHSIEDCYTYLVELLWPEEDLEPLYEMDLEDLAVLCRSKYGFDVRIVEDLSYGM